MLYNRFVIDDLVVEKGTRLGGFEHPFSYIRLLEKNGLLSTVGAF